MSFSSSFDPNNNPSWGFVLIVKRSISPTVKEKIGILLEYGKLLAECGWHYVVSNDLGTLRYHGCHSWIRWSDN
jgi:hypothetical protein